MCEMNQGRESKSLVQNRAGRTLKRKKQVQGLNGFGGTPLTKLSLGAPRTGGQLINIRTTSYFILREPIFS